ncbi:hypothetical protein [Streptomyces sp. NPDC001787]|uniref:hypothetical protein n=1 Tax=Streptomyces sp. NPDC001787 TaxID=3154523 RepID=UPI003319663C
MTGNQQFKRSVKLREATTYSRTHAVTLGYLGEIQVRRGHIEAACSTWNRSLDSMAGVRSARALDTVTTIRRSLADHRLRNVPAALELDARAQKMLTPVA